MHWYAVHMYQAGEEDRQSHKSDTAPKPLLGQSILLQAAEHATNKLQ